MLPAAASVMSRPQHLKLVYNVQETNTARLIGECLKLNCACYIICLHIVEPSQRLLKRPKGGFTCEISLVVKRHSGGGEVFFIFSIKQHNLTRNISFVEPLYYLISLEM